ncbi:hypothetical protein [Haloferula sargassicola]|uniref:hypothetical protein n=1 Tax=Haloferula sargassicola TaxID=490096 RepID=UPI0033655BD0
MALEKNFTHRPRRPLSLWSLAPGELTISTLHNERMMPAGENQLTILEQMLQSGMAAGNIQLLDDCEAGLTSFLLALRRKPESQRLGLIQTEANLLEILGRCRASRFELNASLESLEDGVDDLRQSWALMSEPRFSSYRREIQANLATALVRLGEQTQRTNELREALDHLKPLLVEATTSPATVATTGCFLPTPAFTCPPLPS